MDSRLFVELGSLGVQRAQLMRREGAGFDMTEFLNKLRAKMNGYPTIVQTGEEGDVNQTASLSSLNWEVMGKLAAKWSLKAPSIGFM